MDKEKIILPDPADIAPDNREIPSARDMPTRRSQARTPRQGKPARAQDSPFLPA